MESKIRRAWGVLAALGIAALMMTLAAVVVGALGDGGTGDTLLDMAELIIWFTLGGIVVLWLLDPDTPTFVITWQVRREQEQA